MGPFSVSPWAGDPYPDPSVTQLTNTSQSGLDEFNPFSESSQLVRATCLCALCIPGGGFSGVEGPLVGAVAAAAQAGLLQQQAELERKAAELEKKERELQSHAASIDPRQNNWPPLPKRCPIKPCFYQDFSADIPADYQRICKMLYYLWMLHSITLLLNLLACLAWFTVDKSRGVDFGLSILWLILFTPCAFLCWYRPIYKAFRQQLSLGAPAVLECCPCSPCSPLPGSGWIAALSEVHGNLAVVVIMMVVAAFFTLCAVLSLFLLKQVHSLYRRTGASFQRAQEEFSQGILTNRSFQNAAAGAASSAAQSAFRGN
uniref:Secretory carrier-associated membrane protein n=1 Tax=Cyanistes caeruleus TaxID=156563 RepID=A0A8C0VPJ1_CYACU